jgi:UDP-sugar diphosphatase
MSDSNHHPLLSKEAYCDFEVKNLDKSPYIKPYQILFKQNSIQRSWHCMQSHESVSVLLHDVDRDVIILVKQFRPAVFISNCLEVQKLKDPYLIDFTKANPEVGITYELCSGIVDKEDKNLLEITKEEILEECGYDVPVKNIFEVNTFRAGIGITGFFY